VKEDQPLPLPRRWAGEFRPNFTVPSTPSFSAGDMFLQIHPSHDFLEFFLMFDFEQPLRHKQYEIHIFNIVTRLKKILYSVFMIEQLAHDICFVIILHILDIPLVHRSE
jgi:hypothetical protein